MAPITTKGCRRDVHSPRRIPLARALPAARRALGRPVEAAIDAPAVLDGELRERQHALFAPGRDASGGLARALRVEHGVLGEIRGLRREREARAGLGHRVHHAQVDVLADLEELVPVAGAQVREDLEVERVGAEAHTPKKSQSEAQNVSSSLTD